MASTMVAGPELRPVVLPTDRLQPNGMCRPELRRELRRIPNARHQARIGPKII